MLTELESPLMELEFPLTDLERPLRDFVFPLMEDKFPLMEDKFSVTALEILPSSFSSLAFISGNDKSHQELRMLPLRAKNV